MTKTTALKKLASKDISQMDFESLKTVLEIKQSIGFQIVSGSMEPVIMTGENIVVEPIQKILEKYDIVVFLSGGKLICHYLFHVNQIPSSRNQKTYVTRGLANKFEDFPCEHDFLLGRVVSHKISYWTRARLSFRDFLKR